MSQSFLIDQEHQVYRFSSLDPHKKLLHAVTTRNSFFIPGYTVSLHTGEEQQVMKNREVLRDFFKGKSITIPKQCHGNRVVEITPFNNHEIPLDTDALITKVPGQVIGVLAADCVPVLLYDPVHQALGVAHAGWKGTVAEITSATLRAMAEAYGTNAEAVHAVIGPSISQAHFEVGDEVKEAFEILGLLACISGLPSSKAHIDLWMANRLLLERAGVFPQHISTAEVCTYESTDRFYSARKEGFGTGRFGIFGMITG